MTSFRSPSRSKKSSRTSCRFCTCMLAAKSFAPPPNIPSSFEAKAGGLRDYSKPAKACGVTMIAG